MGANERLSLQIDGKATGTAEIEKLAGALNKVVDISSKIGQRQNGGSGEAKTGFEGFPQQIKTLVENPLASAQSAISSFSSSFGTVGLVASGAVASFTAVAVASENAARHLGDLGVSVRDVSLKTGLSIKEVGQFGFAARSVGQDVTVFESGMRKLSQALADNGPEGDKARKALSDLGVQTRELNGDLKPTSAIFEQIAEGLSHMASSAARNSEVIKIFGRGGIELIPVLDKLNESLGRAKELNFGLSEEDVKRYEKYKEKLNEIDTIWAGIKRRLEDGIVGKISFVYGEARNAVGGFFVNPGGQFQQGGGFSQGFSDLGRDALAPGASAIAQSLTDTARNGVAPLDIAGINSQRLNQASNPAAIQAGINARIDSFTSAQGRIDRFQSNDLNTVSGAERAASKAKQAADAAYNEFTSSKGAGDDFVKQKEVDYLRLATAAKTAEDRVKSLQKAESEAKSARDNEASNIARFQELGRSGDQNPGRKALDDYYKLLTELRINKNQQYTPAAIRAGRLGATQHYVSEVQRISREQGLSADQATNESQTESARLFGEFGAQLGPGFFEALKRGDTVGTNALQSSLLPILPRNRLTSIDRQATSEDALRNLRNVSGHQERLININSGPGDEVATQQKLSDLRTSTAERAFALESNIADLKTTEGERDQAHAEARIKYEQDLFDVQSENVERLAQLRKEQLDREASAVTGLFRASLGGGKGITSYFKDLVPNTGETALSNFVKSKPAALDRFFPHAQEGTTAGNLLKGTLFGPNANNASITSITLNSTATQQNTAATLGLTSAISSFRTTVTNAANASGGSGNSLYGGLPGLFPSSGSGEAGIEGSGIPGSSDNSSGESSGSISTAALSKGRQSYGGFIGGLAHTGDLQGIFTGVSSGPNGAESLSTSERAGAAIGTAGVVVGGVESAYSGFKKGGGKGTLQGISATAGTAAALDPEPISKAVLAGVALVSGFIGSVLGDPKQLRQEAINKTLGNAKYEAPEAQNVSLGINGGYSDTNAFGDIRSSNLSPYPTGAVQPSQYYRNGTYTPIPGSSGTPYGAPITIQNNFTGNVGSQEFFDQSGVMLANTLAKQFGSHSELINAATKATVVG